MNTTTKPQSARDEPHSQGDAVAGLLARFGDMTQRLNHMALAVDRLKDHLNNLGGLAARASFALMMLTGAPNVFRHGTWGLLTSRVSSGSWPGGSAATALDALRKGGGGGGAGGTPGGGRGPTPSGFGPGADALLVSLAGYVEGVAAKAGLVTKTKTQQASLAEALAGGHNPLPAASAGGGHAATASYGRDSDVDDGLPGTDPNREREQRKRQLYDLTEAGLRASPGQDPHLLVAARQRLEKQRAAQARRGQLPPPARMVGFTPVEGVDDGQHDMLHEALSFLEKTPYFADWHKHTSRFVGMPRTDNTLAEADPTGHIKLTPHSGVAALVDTLAHEMTHQRQFGSGLSMSPHDMEREAWAMGQLMRRLYEFRNRGKIKGLFWRKFDWPKEIARASRHYDENVKWHYDQVVHPSMGTEGDEPPTASELRETARLRKLAGVSYNPAHLKGRGSRAVPAARAVDVPAHHADLIDKSIPPRVPSGPAGPGGVPLLPYRPASPVPLLPYRQLPDTRQFRMLPSATGDLSHPDFVGPLHDQTGPPHPWRQLPLAHNTHTNVDGLDLLMGTLRNLKGQPVGPSHNKIGEILDNAGLAPRIPKKVKSFWSKVGENLDSFFDWAKGGRAKRVGGALFQKHLNSFWGWMNGKDGRPGALQSVGSGYPLLVGGAMAAGAVHAASPDAFETLRLSVTILAAQFGDMLLPATVKLIVWTQRLADWFGNLSDGARNFWGWTVAAGLGLTTMVTALSRSMLLLESFGMTCASTRWAVLGFGLAVAAAAAGLAYLVNNVQQHNRSAEQHREAIGDLPELYKEGMQNPEIRAAMAGGLKDYNKQVRENPAWATIFGHPHVVASGGAAGIQQAGLDLYIQRKQKELEPWQKEFSGLQAGGSTPVSGWASRMLFGAETARAEDEITRITHEIEQAKAVRNTLLHKKKEEDGSGLKWTDEEKSEKLGSLLGRIAMVTKAQPTYTSLDQAYQKTQLEVLGKSPLEQYLEDINRKQLVRLIDLMEKQVAGDEELRRHLRNERARMGP